ncbi:unnamed protein product, partial [Owenia fusiformis]
NKNKDLDYMTNEEQNRDIELENENKDLDFEKNEEENLDNNVELNNDPSAVDYTSLNVDDNIENLNNLDLINTVDIHDSSEVESQNKGESTDEFRNSFESEVNSLIEDEVNNPYEVDASNDFENETEIDQNNEKHTSSINQFHGNEYKNLEQEESAIVSKERLQRRVLPNRLTSMAYSAFEYYEQNIKYNCTKHVIYSCGKSHLCGGWSDRIDGILTGLTWSLLTDRCFHIEYKDPCNLYELMETPRTVQLIDDGKDNDNFRDKDEQYMLHPHNAENDHLRPDTVMEQDTIDNDQTEGRPTIKDSSNDTIKNDKDNDNVSGNISKDMPIKETYISESTKSQSNEDKIMNWNGIDWNSKIELENRSSLLLDYVLKEEDSMDEVKDQLANLEVSLDEKYPEDVIIFRNNAPLYRFMIQNPFNKEKLKQMKINPDEYDPKLFITDMCNGLFTLKQPIKTMLESFLKDLNQSQLICAQIRVPDMLMKFSYIFRDNLKGYLKNITNIWTFFENYPKQQDYRIFVTTNSEDVRNASKAQFSENIIDIGGKTMHIDQQGPFEKLACESHSKVILDFEILSYCDVLVITKDSGFGRMASFKRQNKDNLYIGYYEDGNYRIKKKV